MIKLFVDYRSLKFQIMLIEDARFGFQELDYSTGKHLLTAL
jgi:hypothetical protein